MRCARALVLVQTMARACVFMGLALTASAQSGGVPGAFLSYGVGGRAMAMGGAYYAISDDASAAYWNPAGLSQLQRKEVTTMQASLFQGTKLTYFSFAYPTKSGSTFALSMTQLANAGFEKVDVTINPATNEVKSIEAGGSFVDQQQAMGLSWGKGVTETVSFGMSVKQVTRQLAGNSDNFKTLDIGAMKTMGNAYRLGLGMQNVCARRPGETDDPLSHQLAQAIAWLATARLDHAFCGCAN
ncbi:MAG: UPF0164 family protein, partial [Elusimicrobiota bacterium]